MYKTNSKLESHVRVNTWQEFEKQANTLESSGRFVFRGQKNHSWYLAPSLRRIYSDDDLRNLPSEYRDENYIRRLERGATEQFRMKAPSSILDLENASSVDVWAVMQHYGSPTRMLDWTRSIWVSAHFATELANPETAGRVWYVDSEKINELARKSKSSTYAGDNRLLAEEEVTGPGNPVIQFSPPGVFNERIEAQQALHSLCRAVSAYHEDVFIELLEEFEGELEGEKDSHFGSLTIAGSLKLEIRRRLSEQFTSADLFPGIDGVARFINDDLSRQLREVSLTYGTETQIPSVALQNEPRYPAYELMKPRFIVVGSEVEPSHQDVTGTISGTLFRTLPTEQREQNIGGTVAHPIHPSSPNEMILGTGGAAVPPVSNSD